MAYIGVLQTDIQLHDAARQAIQKDVAAWEKKHGKVKTVKPVTTSPYKGKQIPLIIDTEVLK